MPQKCLHNFVLMVVPKIWWNIFCPNSKKSGFGMILASLFKLSDDTDWSSRLSRYLFIVSKPSACRIWGYNPTRSSVTNNVLSGISRSWFNRDKKSLVSSKICGIVGIIVFRWKLRNDEIFSVAVPLFEITGQPSTFYLGLCILGSR